MLKSKTEVGKRDERIIIQERTLSKDEYNQDVETWSTFATVWAKVTDSAGNENYQADQLTAVRNSDFDIRYLDGIGETMRILRDDRFYDIKSIQRPDRRRSLIIKAILLDET